LLSQAVYVFIWLFGFYGFRIAANSENSRSPGTSGGTAIALIVLTLVLSTLLPHLVLEVQGRYHHVLMPFVMLLAAWGLHQAIPRADTAPGAA
jgi:hypothetical protein